MAIKFSQFVVQTDASTLSHVVGYNGVDNIQITPTNFLNSLLTGTAGQVLFYDTTGVTGDSGFYWDNTNKRLGIGTSSPTVKLDVNSGTTNNVARFQSTDSVARIILKDNTGEAHLSASGDDMVFATSSSGSERMRITDAGNVGIGTSTPSEKLEVAGDIKLGDNKILRLGSTSGGDFNLGFDGNNGFASNLKGDLYIQNFANDKDIIFRSDDGSGGITNYIQIDGSAGETIFSRNTQHLDQVYAQFGTSNDLKIYHDGNNSNYITSTTSDIYLRSEGNNDRIYIQATNSGTIANYITIDGSAGQTKFSRDTKHIDNAKAKFGDSNDLEIYHDSTKSIIRNNTGNLLIDNFADDADIIFRSDDGSGGVAEYFRLDGGATKVIASKNFAFLDSVQIELGDSGDFNMSHNGTDVTLQNFTGDFNIVNKSNDADIIFKSDDGSGGTATYFYLDGGGVLTRFDKRLRMSDAVSLQLGSSGNFEMYHFSGDTTIDNFTGNLTIRNSADDADIIFSCDDGSGGTGVYFLLDGSLADGSNKFTRFLDRSRVCFGDAADLQIYHNGTNSLIENSTGDFYISNKHDDGDIIFFCDDGSGGVTEYFRLDGGDVETVFSKRAKFIDNVKLNIGSSRDLQIYHDGSNSFIDEAGTGILYVRAAANMYFQTYGSGKRFASFFENDAVVLYNNDVEKLRTIGSGIRISGVSEYADNTAALAGGLVVGDVYRTGDDLKIVH